MLLPCLSAFVLPAHTITARRVLANLGAIGLEEAARTCLAQFMGPVRSLPLNAEDVKLTVSAEALLVGVRRVSAWELRGTRAATTIWIALVA